VVIVNKDIDQAFDTRIEPWQHRCCHGDCHQGRRQCPHPEVCLERTDARLGCFMIVGISAALWTLIILVVWALLR
jgi:hypothetical protein